MQNTLLSKFEDIYNTFLNNAKTSELAQTPERYIKENAIVEEILKLAKEENNLTKIEQYEKISNNLKEKLEYFGIKFV